MSWLTNLWRTHRWAVLLVAVVLIGCGMLVAARLARSTPVVQVTEVTRGEFVDHLELRGELKAKKSVVLTAPSFAGGDLQIMKLVKNGSPVKKGDLVAAFDATNLERQLLQRQTELRQAESEIERQKAQMNMLKEQDLTEVMKAEYDVERARLETSKQEILSAIDGQKTRLNLANTEQKLLEIRQKLESDATGAKADLETRIQKREKARYDVATTQDRIQALTLRATADGTVNLMPNQRAGGNWGSYPEFKEGDRAWPGAGVAELPDISTIRLSARLEETDRGRLQIGQTATVRLDAIPEREFTACVVAISSMGKPDFSSWPPVRNFDTELEFTELDPRLRPGMSSTTRIAVERIPNSLLIPAEAVFQKGGRTVVYVLRGSQFEEREIGIARRSGSQVAVARGVEQGERVARKDPTLLEGAPKK